MHKCQNETYITTLVDHTWSRDTKRSWTQSFHGVDGEFTSVGYVNGTLLLIHNHANCLH